MQSLGARLSSDRCQRKQVLLASARMSGPGLTPVPPQSFHTHLECSASGIHSFIGLWAGSGNDDGEQRLGKRFFCEFLKPVKVEAAALPCNLKSDFALNRNW